MSEKSYLPYVSLAQKVGRLAFITTFISGVILILFNLFAVKKIFGTYKYIMIIFTALGMFLATLEVIFHPNLHFYNMGYIFFSLAKPFDMDPETLMYFVSFYTGVYCVNISLLAVQFIYRYCAIFSVDYLKYFRGWKSFIWVFYCLFFAVQWLYGVHYMLIPDETTKSYFKQEILDRYSIQDNQVPLRAFMAYDPTTESIRLRNWMFTLNITIIMGVQYGVMIFCGVTMNLKMEARIRNLSSALKKHHKQLFRALVFQITSPTIFLFSPLIMVIYLPFFNIQLSFPAGATVCAFNFYPAMDVIIVMCVVTEYRVAAKKIWISCWKRSGRSEASSRVTHPTTQEAY